MTKVAVIEQYEERRSGAIALLATSPSVLLHVIAANSRWEDYLRREFCQQARPMVVTCQAG
ncbi:hypothetical protein [Paracoccus beibuensis]|uniref:hypothetical protein n=1 Tax=Paracoccus beibuensis TaxID=547602 RepID=UPI00223F33C1|nr:hypothetical protein [Paracoccus beibuensis]